jgi:hypothetical protein
MASLVCDIYRLADMPCAEKADIAYVSVSGVWYCGEKADVPQTVDTDSTEKTAL